jgi:glycine/D-amino acid oxidase-like deaminating enzyme
MRELEEIVGKEEGLGQECEFEVRRSFDVFQDREEMEGVKRVVDEARRRGETWIREIEYIGDVGKDEVEKETRIKGAVGAFSCPAVSMWPYKFVSGLLARLLQRFDDDVVNVQMDTPVTHVSTDNVLTTPRGTIRAGKVVFATNAWTAGLLGEFAGTITPVRGMASHHLPPRKIEQHLDHTYNIFFAKTPSGHSTGVDYLNPRPDGGIVVGGGAWHFRQDRASWWNNFDDSTHFRDNVEAHWDGYMASTFLGWGDSEKVLDMVWTGIMGSTRDGMPHVGRVGGKKQWILAGFNGGGMSIIPTAAKAVARMVVDDSGFEDVKREFGLLEGWGTAAERMEKGQGR